MKKRHSGRKTPLHEPPVSTARQQLNVEQLKSPPPSPANQPKSEVNDVKDPEVTEDLERVKEILLELPNASSSDNSTEKVDANREEKPVEDSDLDTSRSERPVDVIEIPTALKSPNRQHPKNSVGTKVAFVEPVRSVKRDRRRTQKISFENMKEVELKKNVFFEVTIVFL